MKKWIYKQLLLLLYASLTLPALAITVNQQGPNYSTGEFEQQVSDIGVKVMGGYLTYTRKFSLGKWHFNQQWSDIGYAKIRVSAVSSTEPSYVDDTNILLRNSYKYTLEAASDGKIYRYDNEKVIEKTDSGFRWINRDGDWINYNLDGQIIAYGNTLGTTAQFVYNDKNQIEQVRDRTNNLILTIAYESGNPVSVVDYSGRKIIYRWSDGDLVKVTDVNGNDWRYSYNKYNETSSTMVSRAIASIIDPEDITFSITYQVVGGETVQRCTSYGNGTTVLKETVDPDTGQITVEEVYIGGTYSNGSCGDVFIPRQVMMVSWGYNGSLEPFFYDYNGSQKSYAKIQVDGDGVKTRTIYGSDGAVKKLYKGGQLIFSQAKVGDIKLAADADGNKTTTKYDQYNNIIKIEHPDGSSRTATYHPSFNYVTELTDENGVITQVNYNNLGRATKKVSAKGTAEQLTITYSYYDNGMLHTRSYTGNAATKPVTYTFEYDDYGNLTKQTINDQIRNIYQNFTAIGRAKTMIDGRGNTWSYEYDNEGMLTKETDPLNHSRSYLYDKTGNLIKYTNPNLVSFTYSYDAKQQLKTVTDAYGKISHYTINANGVQTAYKDEVGKTFSLITDRTGRPQSRIDGNNNITKFTMGKDPETGIGNFEDLNRVDYPTYSQLYKYNNRRKISQLTILQGEQSSTMSYQYDPRGNLIKETDPNGHSTYYSYDAFDNIIKEDASGFITAYEYNSYDDLVRFTDRNNYVTELDYDAFGRITQKSRLGFGDWIYGYDNNDNLTSTIDPNGQKIVYIYDNANRQIEKNIYTSVLATEPTQSVIYGYDNNDNLTSWQSGTLSGVLIRDNNGRQQSETINYGPFSKSYQYSYYDNGIVKSMTMPDGIVYHYEYDNNNQLTRFKIPGEGSLTINEFNWLAPSKETLPGGVTRNTQYTGLLSTKSLEIKTPGGSSVLSLNFDYGLSQEVVKRSSFSGIAAEEQIIEYQYDDIYRLQQATTTLPDGTQRLETYQLDANSNRVASHNTNNWQYNTAGQLTQSGDREYNYDANGNQIRAGASNSQLSFIYDGQDRLIRVEDASDNIIARYQYDPFDRRLSKTVAGITTYYLYSNEGLIAEYNEQGQELNSYGYRPNSTWGTNPVFLKTSTTRASNPTSNKKYYYYQNDQLGTPYKLTDNTGYVVWDTEFDSFGNALLATNNQIQNNLRFPGQYFDQETGLHYNWRRYYDPLIGRYITPDPIDLAGGPNLYTYVDGDPINRIDPNGECAILGLISGIALETLRSYFADDCFNFTAGDTVSSIFCGAGKFGKFFKRSPCGGRNSFTGDTLVHTINGQTAIKEIKVGDSVLSYAEWNDHESHQSVTDIISNTKEYHLVLLTLTTGKVIESTDQHPFYILGSGWVEAEDLKIGQQLYRGDQGSVGIAKISREQRTETVYNLSVANTNTYFIGQDKVLVHNCKNNKHHLVPQAVYKKYKDYFPENYNNHHYKNKLDLPTPFHGNHPSYSNSVKNKIKDIFEKNKGPLSMNDVKKLQNDLNVELSDLLKSGKYEKLNDFYKNTRGIKGSKI